MLPLTKRLLPRGVRSLARGCFLSWSTAGHPGNGEAMMRGIESAGFGDLYLADQFRQKLPALTLAG